HVRGDLGGPGLSRELLRHCRDLRERQGRLDRAPFGDVESRRGPGDASAVSRLRDREAFEDQGEQVDAGWERATPQKPTPVRGRSRPALLNPCPPSIGPLRPTMVNQTMRPGLGLGSVTVAMPDVPRLQKAPA